MYEKTILAIQNYMNKYLFEPQINWSKREFLKRSYSRWAASEILERIMDRPFDQPDIIVEGFFLEMYMFIHSEEESESDLIFSTARDTAEDILHLIS